MLFRAILISLSCVAVTSCSANAEFKAPQSLNASKSVQNSKLSADEFSNSITIKSSSSKEQNHSISLVDNLSGVPHATHSQDLNKGNKQSQRYSAVTEGNYMMLVPTGQVNALGNPLYELRLFANQQQVGSYKIVSGRAYTQNRDRDRSGTEAPLPDGRYQIATSVTRGGVIEAGDRFLPIQPLFPTSRSALGIHYDPSYEKDNGEDGTSGCIGLTNREDLSQVLDYVRAYHPQFLNVAIR